jgi:hypothetical protein
MAVECTIPEGMEVVEDENPLMRYALILPFFFWGSSMVAMKVRRCEMPREDGLAGPADTSRSNLASAWVCFQGEFPTEAPGLGF